jgi:hypothetical protein
MAKSQIIDNETGEVIEAEGKALRISEQAAPAIMVNGMAIRVKKQVTLPTLKHDSGQTVLVRITDPFVSETSVEKKTVKVAGVDTEIEEEKTLHIARVTELQSGENFTYVLNAITHDNIVGAYPNDDYVGKCFAIQKLGTVQGKRYKDVKVVEIEVETE